MAMKTPRASKRPARILVVENDPGIGEALVDVCAEDGYDARSATDGAGAVAMAREWEPDAVLLGFLLPPLKEKVVRALGSDPHTAHTPLLELTPDLVLSANASRGGSDDPERRGARGP